MKDAHAVSAERVWRSLGVGRVEIMVSYAEMLRERKKKHKDSREICTEDRIPLISVFEGFSRVSDPEP